MAQSNKERRSHLSNITEQLAESNCKSHLPCFVKFLLGPPCYREPWAKHFISLNWILPYICQPISLFLSVCIFRKRDFIFTTVIKETLTIMVAYYKHQFKWLLNKYLKIPFSIHLQQILDLLRVRNGKPPSMLWGDNGKVSKETLTWKELTTKPSWILDLQFSEMQGGVWGKGRITQKVTKTVLPVIA